MAAQRRKRNGAEATKRLTKAQLLAHITRFYLDSRDFNGLPCPAPHPTHPDFDTFMSQFLPQRQRSEPPQFSADDVKALIGEGLVSLNRGDRHPNPHVKAFPPEPIEEQIRKIDEGGLVGCLYPEPRHLSTIVDRAKYSDRPFRLLMALGEPCLSYRVFDLSVLEQYRNDPRYRFDVDDVHGTIGVVEDSDGATPESLDASHHAFIQSFGFAYSETMDRGVAVFLRYMDQLTPEHQRIWQSRMLSGTNWALHPDYIASTLGHWPEKVPILVAFTEEIRIINEMAQQMGRPPFFRREVHGEARPPELMFLLRPTRKAYYDFVHLMDKLLSENINLKFFEGDVPTEEDTPRPDGKIVVRQKASIRVFSDWLDQKFRASDSKPLEEMIKTLRDVRKLRQKPAHALNDDVFDQTYFRKQRDLICRAYAAVRTIRQIFANHPAAKSVEVPDHLFRGAIRDY